MTANAADMPWDDETGRLFRRTVRRFVEAQLAPKQARWRAQHRPDPEDWLAGGKAGILLPAVPEDFGGGGGTIAHEIIVAEELARAGIAFGSGIQCIVARYLTAYGSEAQKRRWLPAMASGELVSAIALTEPCAGSDLSGIATTARKDGGAYVINGSKTFITNGTQAGLVCVAAKTDPDASPMRRLSLLFVETKDATGYTAGPPLEKIGMQGQDTCELFFDNVRIPAENLLGPREGQGLMQMMEQLPYERLAIAASALAAAEQAVATTAAYAKDRAIGSKTLMDLQNTRFRLAESLTEVRIGRAFLNQCIQLSLDGRLDEGTSAMAKYWLTEAQGRIIDTCLQLHGGYGYMAEYPISRLWTDARVQRIYAGTNEVMKELIACSL
jgi:acyl-CoA dehydrogenase